MGGEPRRGGSLTPALAATLARVGDAMAAAAWRRWWVIGSAAVVLHRGETEVRDVDVVLAVEDVERVMAATGAMMVDADGDALFRSDCFLRWDDPPLAVEFMAGFRVRSGGGWLPVSPRTRERVVVGGGEVFVPSRAELRAMLVTFGRPKDLARAALLPA